MPSARSTSRRAYDLLADGFGPGFYGPLVLVADRADASARSTFTTVLSDIGHTPGVAVVSPTMTLGAGAHAILTARVIPTTAPQAAATTNLVRHLRNHVVPAATRDTGLDVRIGGVTAVQEDFSHTIARHLALFTGLVIALSFVLLAIAFRSLLIPAPRGRDEPALGGRCLRRCHRSVREGLGQEPHRLEGLAQSNRSSPSSCSRSCSGSRWTTRSSWSPACTSSGYARGTTASRSPAVSPTPAGSSLPLPRSRSAWSTLSPSVITGSSSC